MGHKFLNVFNKITV